MTQLRLIAFRLAVIAVPALVLSACGPHRVRGLVRSGPEAAATIVPAESEQLRGRRGLDGAVVELTLDPGSLSPKDAGKGVADSRGRFAVELDELGAGVLEYRLGVFARRSGHKTLWQTLRVPERDERLLIVLTPGKGGERPEKDLVDETLEMMK